MAKKKVEEKESLAGEIGANLDSAQTTIESKEVPSIDDSGWTDYILSLLDKDEKISTVSGEAPTVDGLARVANLVISPKINVVKTEVIQASKDYACVKVTISNGLQSIDGVAEVYPENTDSPFSMYPAATAETRALGRAYRKLLRLKKVFAAEEVSKKASISLPNINVEDTNKITDSHIMFIDMMCERLNISVMEVMENICGPKTSIRDYSEEQAISVNAQLSSWCQDRTKLPSFSKYDREWRGK